METYGYEMEELIPVVAGLAESYTGHEHSSVTYERAQMLMGAVLYCIGEYEGSLAYAGKEERKEVLFRNQKASAEEAYKRGRELVLEKVKNLREFYNEMIPDFQDYGLICLGGTVRKGIPLFFQDYDVKFSPQETVLAPDYPVLRDLSGLSGVNAVWEYVKCIAVEQRFLGKLPVSLVREILRAYHEEYEKLIDNMCSIVLEGILRGMVKAGEESVGIIAGNADVTDKQQALALLLKKGLKEKFDCDKEVMEYLELAIPDIVMRMHVI